MCAQGAPSGFQAVVDALNANSGAIQAASTVVLVGITWWYARLTQKLSQIAKEQLQESKAVRKEQAQEKQAIVRELLQEISTALEEIPNDASLIRTRHLSKVLTNFDRYQQEFTRVGASLSLDVKAQLQIAVDSLRTLRSMAGRDLNIGADDVVYNADLVILNLREAAAKALGYLSSKTDQ